MHTPDWAPGLLRGQVRQHAPSPQPILGCIPLDPSSGRFDQETLRCSKHHYGGDMEVIATLGVVGHPSSSPWHHARYATLLEWGCCPPASWATRRRPTGTNALSVGPAGRQPRSPWRLLVDAQPSLQLRPAAAKENEQHRDGAFQHDAAAHPVVRTWAERHPAVSAPPRAGCLQRQPSGQRHLLAVPAERTRQGQAGARRKDRPVRRLSRLRRPVRHVPAANHNRQFLEGRRERASAGLSSAPAPNLCRQQPDLGGALPRAR